MAVGINQYKKEFTMNAKRQHRVMQAILANNPRITVGEMARRLNYIKDIFEK